MSYRYPLFMPLIMTVFGLFAGGTMIGVFVQPDEGLPLAARLVAAALFGGLAALGIGCGAALAARFELDDSALTEVWLWRRRRLELSTLKGIEHSLFGGKMIVHGEHLSLHVHKQLLEYADLYERLKAWLPPEEALQEAALPGDVSGSCFVVAVYMALVLGGLAGTIGVALHDPPIPWLVGACLAMTGVGVWMWYVTPLEYVFGEQEIEVRYPMSTARYPMAELNEVESTFIVHRGQRIHSAVLRFDDGRELRIGDGALDTPYEPLIAALQAIVARRGGASPASEHVGDPLD